MTYTVDATHAADLQSWVDSANDPQTEFPIQNLPVGRFRQPGEACWSIGVAIGDQILDVCKAGILESSNMAHLLAWPEVRRRDLRRTLSEGLRWGSASESKFRSALLPMDQMQLGLPCDVGDYTDFYTSIHHATTVGKQFRPENPLLPNYKWVPIGYHGRASSIVPSGTNFYRPRGQTRPGDQVEPTLTPSRRLDYELELGVVIASGNSHGSSISISDAESHVFGLTLFNDWSARDIQGWEYQPLGPFLAKNFASTISPWMVTLDALAPFRTTFERPAGDPQPLPYLDSPDNRARGGVDIQLEVWLQTATMRTLMKPAERISHSNYRDAYWTIAQLVTHHTVNGCNLRPGDLFGSGTLSGPMEEEAGSMLELSRGGKKPIQLQSGETRTFLEDGDRITLKAYCQRDGFRRIGFGECSGTVLPARET